MKYSFRRIVYSFSAILFFSPIINAQVKQVKLTDFNLQSAAIISAPGDSLSSPKYISKNYWFPVKVPSTVLSGLVANKVYPDPYIGMNNMLIPDASDSFNHQYHLEQYSHLPNDPNPWIKPYWYRTSFIVPNADKGKMFQLIFKGINYRAEVWLNGKLIADSSQMAGMFATYNLDVTSAIRAGEENALAVKIYPLDFPGLPSHPQLNALDDFYPNGGPTGDIGKNVTMLCSIGWDWIPEVRDRNIGIWQPVYLRTTGHVTISKPQVITDLPSLPDTGIAKISLHFTLSDNSGVNQNGKLKISITPENFIGQPISFTKDVSVDGSGSKDISISGDETKELIIHQPHLWWPNGYGYPNLYKLRIQFVNGEKISDESSFIFGIRTASSKTQEVNGWLRRDFFVNGKKIHLVGGAWVPDMMLNRDSLRYDYELRLCRNANVNLVRIWGGGLAETDDFYELTDRYGLLVWQDFWVTGDTQGEFKGSPDWPLQGNLFIRNVISTIYRIRNHPSLLVWTGGNEGHAREELYNAMRDNVTNLDGTRPFIPSSSGFAKQQKGWKGSWPDDKPAGVYSGGPYSWQDAIQYYKLVNRGRDWLFKDETGLPSQPPYNTLPKIISNLVPDNNLPYPLNNTWGYHDACSGNGKYDIYYKAMVNQYGAPTSFKDFSDKMQLVNANGYRGIFEAVAHKLNETGGVMLWKLNAAFPSVMWQIYDWYLEPNAGYYFMQNACEPVHIQFNLDDSAVAVINRTYHRRSNLSFKAEIFDINGNSLYKNSGNVSLDESDVKKVLSLGSILQGKENISFVVLNLKDANGKYISHNTYWMAPNQNYLSLSRMPSSKLQVKIIKSAKEKDLNTWTLQLTNVSRQLAFFINPQIIKDGEELLPSFWSENYFSLATNESITITVSCPLEKLKQSSPMLRIEGWNVEKQEFNLAVK
jgi:beta-galactosidase/beta-glucuronidase